ncbi:MAG: hypothetical protein ACTSXJ_02615 [Candidatus Baldrarchaeia archaeon]
MIRLVVFCFHFSSKPSDPRDLKRWSVKKTKFYRELYGADVKNVRRRKDGTVTERVYHVRGLLDGIPHIKLDRSVFAVPPEFAARVRSFFEKYADEVDFCTFIGLFDEDIIRKNCDGGELLRFITKNLGDFTNKEKNGKNYESTNL